MLLPSISTNLASAVVRSLVNGRNIDSFIVEEENELAFGCVTL
jgi:hypothetical protein|tara:strand:+ start:10048 stop:10176 length:129 start_codon:yes stop_codon:yes gene_type:complete